jgi:hypothetical protein
LFLFFSSDTGGVFSLQVLSMVAGAVLLLLIMRCAMLITD